MATRLTWAIRLVGVSLAVAPAFVTVARAADEPGPTTRNEGGQRRGRGQMLKHIQDIVMGLNLTDEQKPKIEAAFADAKAKIQEATKDANGDRDAIRQKVGPIIKNLIETVNGILTDEQKKEFEAQRPKPGQRGNGAGNPGGTSK